MAGQRYRFGVAAAGNRQRSSHESPMAGLHARSQSGTMTSSSPRFDVQPSVGNHFAWMRTQMALQRTLMAAVRTSVSLIGFGFTVAQFFQKMLGSAPPGVTRLGPEAPRNLGMTLIAAGVISLAVFTWQYHSAVGYMRGGDYKVIAAEGDKSMRTSVYLVAFTVMGIGVAAFALVFARI
jgi:putative membrane protein